MAPKPETLNPKPENLNREGRDGGSRLKGAQLYAFVRWLSDMK